MATITAAMVKELRESTGAGMMDCKAALTETAGDMTAARLILDRIVPVRKGRPVRLPLPPVKTAGWGENRIDAFVLGSESFPLAEVPKAVTVFGAPQSF